jgi:mRNA interferase RelE/StbE
MRSVKTIVLTAGAAKQLDALPPIAQEQVVDALEKYAISGTGDVKPLIGRDGYRLRAGQYRIIFAEDQVSVLAVYIGRRQTNTYGRN